MGLFASSLSVVVLLSISDLHASRQPIDGYTAIGH